MRGSVDWQIKEIFKGVNDLGSSKHAAKEEARAGGARTWEQVGQTIGVHSKNTYQDYTQVARALFEHAKAEYGLKDITRIEPHMVQSFLLDKIDNQAARATLNTYSSAVHKLESALNKYSELKGLDRQYSFGLKEVAKYAAQALGDKNTDSRAYQNVDRLVGSLDGKYALLGNILRETGFRISEGAKITADQLKGTKMDPYDKQMKHWVSAVGKGGKIYERPLTEATYRALERVISEKGAWKCNQSNFREALQGAASRSGQRYEGPHGIRWSVAQERHAGLQKLGYSYESSLKIVSSELNHIRGDITRHYLH